MDIFPSGKNSSASLKRRLGIQTYDPKDPCGYRPQETPGHADLRPQRVPTV